MNHEHKQPKNICLFFKELRDPWHKEQMRVMGELWDGEIFFYEYYPSYIEKGRQGMEQHMLRYIDEKNIDIGIFFSIKMFDFSLSFFRILQRKMFVTLWNIDDETYFDVSSGKYAQAADFAVTSDYYGVEKFKQLGLEAVYNVLPYSKKIYYPISEIQRDIDVSFVGNIGKQERKQFLDALEQADIPVCIFGKGNTGKFVSQEEMVTIFNRSKINLNFTATGNSNWLTQDNKLCLRRRQIKGRVCEVALTKSFLLTQYAPGIEHVFEIGKEIDVFYTIPDMLEKIAYYLEHEDEREAMAERAYQRALQEYEMFPLLRRILSALQSAYVRPEKKQEVLCAKQVYTDTAFLKNYATYRFFYIGKFLRAGNFKCAFQECKIVFQIRRVKWKQAMLFLFQAFRV